MSEVVQAENVLHHRSQNGAEFFTIAATVSVRYGDYVHHGGRRYLVERVEQVRDDGCHVVRAAYSGKL